MSAIHAAAAAKNGSVQKTRKVRTSVHFYLPKTYKQESKPKFTKVTKANTQSGFDLLREPVFSDRASMLLELNNTITFIVAKSANKHAIRAMIEKTYNVKVSKVNTLIRPDGQKKAFIKLATGFSAEDVASKMKLF